MAYTWDLDLYLDRELVGRLLEQGEAGNLVPEALVISVYLERVGEADGRVHQILSSRLLSLLYPTSSLVGQKH